MSKKILECSSAGDKRFSAFYAQVVALGKLASMENHYQSVKRKIVLTVMPRSTTQSLAPVKKGEKVDSMVLELKTVENKVITRYFEPKYLTPWYKLLWVKYLDKNKN